MRRERSGAGAVVGCAAGDAPAQGPFAAGMGAGRGCGCDALAAPAADAPMSCSQPPTCPDGSITRTRSVPPCSRPLELDTEDRARVFPRTRVARPQGRIQSQPPAGPVHAGALLGHLEHGAELIEHPSGQIRLGGERGQRQRGRSTSPPWHAGAVLLSCTTRTFFRSAACDAVKIRCRSRRTSSSMARQPMASQSKASSSGPFTPPPTVGAV